ncbi:hypothetical protein BMR1_03g02300 [Babesia microti strain RI]|uniref:Uncharacterized protein n=1 Tax=Babesia microti (strain RI) TaxID=1133968 RepID=A0A0K3ARI3_BABMR|nr:hypothetical protein BMR1_03g02300 [Babesia microti strain RI]CTQ41060.1 hypothetical protein BMR1_03g02300 [Babesia microti strain RI]|eukprot:XP_012649071.1 hypothetical protein BMR1_03g02300 [Babesia microti strain RI]
MRFTLKSAIKLIYGLVDVGFSRHDIHYMLSERSNELLKAGVDPRHWQAREKIAFLSSIGIPKSQALDIIVNNPLLLASTIADIDLACKCLAKSGASIGDYVTLLAESLEMIKPHSSATNSDKTTNLANKIVPDETFSTNKNVKSNYPK